MKELAIGNIVTYQEEGFSCANFVDDIKERFATAKNVNELLRFNPHLLRGTLDAGAAAAALYSASLVMSHEDTLKYGLSAGICITVGVLLNLLNELGPVNRQKVPPKITTATEAVVTGVKDALSDLKFSVVCVAAAPFVALAMKADVWARYIAARRLLL